jgi:hypothetical protein
MLDRRRNDLRRRPALTSKVRPSNTMAPMPPNSTTTIKMIMATATMTRGEPATAQTTVANTKMETTDGVLPPIRDMRRSKIITVQHPRLDFALRLFPMGHREGVAHL